MRFRARLIVALGLWIGGGPLLFADDAKEAAIKKDRTAMEGTWKMVTFQVDGNQPASEDQLGAVKVTVDGNGKLTVKAEGTTLVEATTKIDPSKDPKTIDFTFTEGQMQGQNALGIYEIKGDTLRYCRAAPGKDRPKEFSSKEGSGCTLVVYKREKAK